MRWFICLLVGTALAVASAWLAPTSESMFIRLEGRVYNDISSVPPASKDLVEQAFASYATMQTDVSIMDDHDKELVQVNKETRAGWPLAYRAIVRGRAHWLILPLLADILAFTALAAMAAALLKKRASRGKG